MWSPALVHWPNEHQRRDRLARDGVPRLLLLEPGTAVPNLAEDEDWVRLPATERDVAARLQHLRRRLDAAIAVEDGVLSTARGVAVLAPREARLMQVLVARHGRVATHGELLAALDAEESDRRRLHDAVHRLRRHTRPLGLDITSAPNRGYILSLRSDDTAAQPSPPDSPISRPGATRRRATRAARGTARAGHLAGDGRTRAPSRRDPRPPAAT
jgi:DNA-binding winged helix-turn-helix (wHTH) protein